MVSAWRTMCRVGSSRKANNVCCGRAAQQLMKPCTLCHKLHSLLYLRMLYHQWCTAHCTACCTACCTAGCCTTHGVLLIVLPVVLQDAPPPVVYCKPGLGVVGITKAVMRDHWPYALGVVMSYLVSFLLFPAVLGYVEVSTAAAASACSGS
jgi:hypothetical protein